MSDPKKPCDHPKFKQDVKVSHVEIASVAIKQLVVKLKLACAVCDRPFLFEGPVGFSTLSPSVSPDMIELRAPIHWPLRDEDEEKIIPTQ